MLLGHEKINFLYLPTPLERLNNLSQDLGINLYIKRDDLTPPARPFLICFRLSSFVCPLWCILFRLLY